MGKEKFNPAENKEQDWSGYPGDNKSAEQDFAKAMGKLESLITKTDTSKGPSEEELRELTPGDLQILAKNSSSRDTITAVNAELNARRHKSSGPSVETYGDQPSYDMSQALAGLSPKELEVIAKGEFADPKLKALASARLDSIPHKKGGDKVRRINIKESDLEEEDVVKGDVPLRDMRVAMNGERKPNNSSEEELG